MRPGTGRTTIKMSCLLILRNYFNSWGRRSIGATHKSILLKSRTASVSSTERASPYTSAKSKTAKRHARDLWFTQTRSCMRESSRTELRMAKGHYIVASGSTSTSFRRAGGGIPTLRQAGSSPPSIATLNKSRWKRKTYTK